MEFFLMKSVYKILVSQYYQIIKS